MQGMNKIARIDLSELPWPANLLKCHRHTGEMQPGDRMVISVKDKDVKDSLLLILNALPGHSFDVTTIGSGYTIEVTKNKSRISTKERDYRDVK